MVLYYRKMTTLSNEAMVPSKLQCNLITNHLQHKDKPKEYFEMLKINSKIQSKTLKKFHPIPEKAQITSYKTAQLLAKKKKPHSDAKNIILPAFGTMVSDEAIKQTKTISLSVHTISCKIQYISQDIEDQLHKYLTEAKNELENLWVLKINESTD
eukprot:XP_014788620.1 PREDICTED: SCAN domain-containing protein 3-like [Octopus bimaculoides]